VAGDPTAAPTPPTKAPTNAPTHAPTTLQPTQLPTAAPTATPTTAVPTSAPTLVGFSTVEALCEGPSGACKVEGGDTLTVIGRGFGDVTAISITVGGVACAAPTVGTTTGAYAEYDAVTCTTPCFDAWGAHESVVVKGTCATFFTFLFVCSIRLFAHYSFVCTLDVGTCATSNAACTAAAKADGVEFTFDASALFRGNSDVRALVGSAYTTVGQANYVCISSPTITKIECDDPSGTLCENSPLTATSTLKLKVKPSTLLTITGTNFGAVSCILCTVTFHANHAHNLTRSP
jgi:hypothetical protein